MALGRWQHKRPVRLLSSCRRIPLHKMFSTICVSERGQARVEQLLTLNKEGMLSEIEELELDELEKIEHVMIMLKSRIAIQDK